MGGAPAIHLPYLIAGEKTVQICWSHILYSYIVASIPGLSQLRKTSGERGWDRG